MTVLSTFHNSHHIYTFQPAMLPLFWCLDTGRLRVSDVSSFRSRHVACTGCPRNGHFLSDLILLISNSNCSHIFTNLHIMACKVFKHLSSLYKPAYYTRPRLPPDCRLQHCCSPPPAARQTPCRRNIHQEQLRAYSINFYYQEETQQHEQKSAS